MPRLITVSLAMLALVALLATASAASSSTAHSNKSKGKGKAPVCPNAEQCKLGTQAQIESIWSYLGTTFAYIDARVTIGGSADCDLIGATAFDTVCNQDLRQPRTVYSTTRCPPGYTQVVQTDCWGWALDGDQNFVGPLPLYDSGAIGSIAYCRLGTEGLADNTVVQIYQTITCSSFVGAVASASATRVEAPDQAWLSKAKGV